MDQSEIRSDEQDQEITAGDTTEGGSTPTPDQPVSTFVPDAQSRADHGSAGDEESPSAAPSGEIPAGEAPEGEIPAGLSVGVHDVGSVDPAEESASYEGSASYGGSDDDDDDDDDDGDEDYSTSYNSDGASGYYSPEEVVEEEIPDPTFDFDIETDEIPSFGSLLAVRSPLYATQRAHDVFRRTVEGMASTGDEGRRRALGFWLLGRYEDAASALEAYGDDDVASYTRARSLMSLGKPGEAVAIFGRLADKYQDEPRPRGDMLDAKLDHDLLKGDVEAAVAALEADLAQYGEMLAESAEGRYLRGRVAELSGDYQEALEQFQAGRAADPTHRRNLFRLAYLSERTGQEALALDAYETLAMMLPVDRSVMINLGVLYEDMGRDSEAASCYDTITRTDPTDRFARLYLEDAKAGMEMYYDEDLEKKEDRLNQILRIPITDFELSVRARNCLNKMDIMTLGDLVKKTESELLSYKNFGETSLTEIKEILASKGLRLGMAREEAVASIAKARNAQEGRDLDPNDPRNKPIGDLKLSIRARRTVENLGCLTLGDVTQHSEEELLGMPNFGVTSLLELRNRLAEYTLALKGES